MASANVSNRVDTIKGSFNQNRSVPADGEVGKDPILAAAKTGALTTRTSSSVGTLTMDTGHSIATGNRLDLYWVKTDGSRGYRYGITVGTVATNSVPITGGSGDDLPDDETTITAMVPRLETFPVLTAAMQLLCVGCEVPMIAIFIDGSAAVVLAVTVDGTNDSYIWDVNGEIANPFADDVAEVYLSHGSSGGTFRPIAYAEVN